MSPIKLIVVGLVALGAITGCKPFKLKPPAGFAEVENWERGAHLKGSDDVGLKVSVFDNVKGGTLAFWSSDLVDKLGLRGYTLTAQRVATSANGVQGTRFDFEYEPPGKDTEKRFFSTALFITDKHRVVVQLAGRAEHYAEYAERFDEIASSTKTRGCRSWTKICKGPQPGDLSTPAPKKAEPASQLADSKLAGSELADSQ